MPTELGRSYQPVPMLTPPGMSIFDRRIFNRAIMTLPDGIIGLYFNVCVGKGRDPDPAFTDRQRRQWWRLTCKRIDVLIEYSMETWIVEARRYAQSSAIGRLLSYKKALLQDDPFGKPIRLVLISDQIDPDVKELAASMDIRYHVIGIDNNTNMETTTNV